MEGIDFHFRFVKNKDSEIRAGLTERIALFISGQVTCGSIRQYICSNRNALCEIYVGTSYRLFPHNFEKKLVNIITHETLHFCLKNCSEKEIIFATEKLLS